MTTPDLEGLAREHEEIAHCAIWEAIIELGNAHQTGFFQTSRQDFHLTEARDCYDMAVTHRQAAALIRSAPAPGREEISNEIHIALQRLHYADLSWIAGSADGFERATLAIADHLLSALFHAPAEAGSGEAIEACDWPAKPFRFYDDPGKHDPCYVVMPDGAMIPLNHHAGEGVDVARAHFIVDACNAALAPEAMVRTAGAKLLTALERYGFPVSDAASTAAMSVEARDLHNAARRFKIAITSTKRPADEPAVTNGQ